MTSNYFVQAHQLVPFHRICVRAYRKIAIAINKSPFLLLFSIAKVPKPPGQPEILNYNTTNLLLKWPASPSDICNYDSTDADIEAQSNVTYVIEYRTSKTYSWSVFAANLKTLSTFVDGLYPGLVYSFRVRAENSSGISDCSPVASTKNLRDEQEEPVELRRVGSYRYNKTVGLTQLLLKSFNLRY